MDSDLLAFLWILVMEFLENIDVKSLKWAQRLFFMSIKICLNK